MIITINGNPGSGKTTVAKRIAKKIGFKHVSMGDIRGEIAKKHNMTINELNELGLKEDWTDKEPDAYLQKLGKEEDNLAIDSWLAFHFIPHSLKIFIKCDPDIGAARIFKNQRDDEEHQKTVEGLKEMNQKRWENSRQRYLKWYDVDIDDLEPYDLIIDSTHKDIEEVIDEIMKKIGKKI